MQSVDVTRGVVHNEKPLGTVQVRERSISNPTSVGGGRDWVCCKPLFAQASSSGQGGFAQ